MPKHKPNDPIYNNRWKSIIDFIGNTLLSMFTGVGGLISDSVFDCIEDLMKGKNRQKDRHIKK